MSGKSTDLRVLALLILTAIVLRLPFFFPAVINWDEGAFILVGQSLVDGQLPYVERFALKPPLAFAFYAAVIAVAGKSLVAIRLAGALCVAAAAFLLYLAVGPSWGRRVGLLAALLCVLVTGFVYSGQATMTEHIALVPLMGALVLLARSAVSAGTCFLAGVLLAVATLVRINLSYVAVLVGVFLLVTTLRAAPSRAAPCVAAYAAGGGLVVALTWLPYALTGRGMLWWTAVVLTPFNYAHTQSPPLLNLKLHALESLGIYKGAEGVRYVGHVVATFVWLAAVAGAVALARRWRAVVDGRGVALFALFTLGVGAGIVQSGPPHGHHMIQLVPFAAALAALLVDRFTGRARRPAWLLVGLLAAASLSPIVAGYRTIVTRIMAGKTPSHGVAFEIADYLKRENPQRRPVYLLSDQVAYWLSGSPPPTMLSTHPGSITERPVIGTMVGEDASTAGELRKVFLQRPEFVITTPRLVLFDGETRRWLQAVLETDYVETARIRGRIVYRRR